MAYKVIKVDDDKVLLRNLKDNVETEYKSKDFDFEPEVGDECCVETKIIKKPLIRDYNFVDNNKVQGNERTKSIYLMLCFFLGVWGMHHFYARRIARGFIYLIITFMVFLMPFVVDKYKNYYIYDRNMTHHASGEKIWEIYEKNSEDYENDYLANILSTVSESGLYIFIILQLIVFIELIRANFRPAWKFNFRETKS